MHRTLQEKLRLLTLGGAIYSNLSICHQSSPHTYDGTTQWCRSWRSSTHACCTCINCLNNARQWRSM